MNEAEREKLNQQLESLKAEVQRLTTELKHRADLEATLWDRVPLVMFRVNREGRVQQLNHAATAAVGGQDKDDLIGLLGGELFRCVNAFLEEGCGRGVPCQTCPVRLSVEETFRRGEGVYRREGMLKVDREDGPTKLHFLVSTALVPERADEVIVSLEDIVAIKQAEIALEQSQKYSLLAQEAAHIGNWRYDVASDALFWSEELFRIYGLEPEGEVADLHLGLGMIHPEDRDRAKEAFRRALEQGLESRSSTASPDLAVNSG